MINLNFCSKTLKGSYLNGLDFADITLVEKKWMKGTY